jgi:hypothetical protein
MLDWYVRGRWAEQKVERGRKGRDNVREIRKILNSETGTKLGYNRN